VVPDYESTFDQVQLLVITLSVMSTMKTPRAKLDALLALLNAAGQEAIAEYEQMGEIPSMESAHPLDSQSPTLRLKRTLRVLEGACEALCTTLAPPAHTLLNVSTHHHH
jgi:hypothetical protein